MFLFGAYEKQVLALRLMSGIKKYYRVKGKPVERQGRKATGLRDSSMTAGLPKRGEPACISVRYSRAVAAQPPPPGIETSQVMLVLVRASPYFPIYRQDFFSFLATGVRAS